VVDDWYRFDVLALTALSGAVIDEDGESLLMNQLNGLWVADIARDQLNILFTVTAVTDTAVELELVSGARVGGEGFCQIDATRVTLTLPIVADDPATDENEAQLGPSQSSSMSVFAGSIAAPKNCSASGGLHAIPVENATVVARCNEDTGVVSGDIEGALTETALKTTCTCIADLGNDEILSDEACGTLDTSGESTDASPCGSCVGQKEGSSLPFAQLSSLIPTLNGGGDIEYPCTGADGTTKATCIGASYSATKLDSAPPLCE